MLTTMDTIMLKSRKRRESPTQDALLEFLKDYKQDPLNDGNNPTYDEIGRAIGCSGGSAYQAALKLVAKGILKMNNRTGKLILGGRYFPPEDL
jgi:hypothetical protein